MHWQNLTNQEQHNTLVAAMGFGGSFVNRLAEAWQYADSVNSAKLGEAFPEIVDRYGPASSFYKEAR